MGRVIPLCDWIWQEGKRAIYVDEDSHREKRIKSTSSIEGRRVFNYDIRENETLCK